MHPCDCYIKMYQKCDTNEQKLNIPCERKYINLTAMVKGYNGQGYCYYDCPKCKECHEKTGLVYRKYKSSNTIFNDFGDGRYELVVYDKPFAVLEEHANLHNDNERNYRKVDTEKYGTLLIPRDTVIRDSHLYSSLSKCSNRAQDNYYGLALANKWKYFATFTISPDMCDRYNDTDVKGCWDLFRQRLVKKYPGIKYLCVPERHEDGALHFHTLIDYSGILPLKPYQTKQGYQYSKSGALLYTFDDWKYGICTLAIIPEEDNQCAVINYLISYTTKQTNLGWGQRRFFATRNLLKKTKDNFTEEDSSDIDIKYDLMQVKRIDGKMTVYRNFNNEQKESNNKKLGESQGYPNVNYKKRT